MSTRAGIALVAALAIAACASSLSPAREKLAPWTTTLRETQPEDAFAAVYVYRLQRLVFIGASHATRTDSLTFTLIDQAYERFDVDTVIVEGAPYSRGANAERLLGWADAQHEVDGFLEGGEAVPAIRGARARGADVWGGEPDDADVRSRVLAWGFTLQDLLGFYTLRSVPQWIGERKVEGAGDDRVKPLIEAELAHNRERLGAPAMVLPDYDAWAAWYTRTNGKEFGAAFELEEVGPLVDGRYGSNEIAHAISRARDEFLLRSITDHLNAGADVMVVFGGSHLMILRPALDDMLGAPCYLGSDFASAPRACLGAP